MNEKILKAIKSLKDEIDALKTEKKDDIDLELIKEKITKMIQGYHIKDKHWYYDNFDTGIVAEGKEGPTGPKGEAFKFEDFTPEQLILLTGADGKQGVPGKDGRDGRDGRDGKDGKDGKDGLNGLPGRDGVDGITPEFVVRSVKHVATQTPPKFEMEKIDNIYYIDVEIPRGKVGPAGKDGLNGGGGKGGSSANLKDYVKFTDYATEQTAGVGLSSSTFGVFRNTDNNYWTIKKANESEIDKKTNAYLPIVPSNLDYAVRSVRPATLTTIPSTLQVNKIYDLGIQSNLTLNLPNGVLGDFIQVDFLCDVATTLTITSSIGMSDYDLIPEANKIYSLYFDFGRIEENTYGWRIAYAEYSRTEV